MPERDSYGAFMVVRATWADGSYWTTDAPGRQEGMPLPSMSPGNLPSAMTDRLKDILVQIHNTKAKTNPVDYAVNGFIEASYADGRQATQQFNHKAAESNELLNYIDSWAAAAVKKLVEIGSDDI